MGVVSIPANPSGPGHVSVHLQLDATEVQSISALLRQAGKVSNVEHIRQEPDTFSATARVCGPRETFAGRICRPNIQNTAAGPEVSERFGRHTDQSQQGTSPSKGSGVSPPDEQHDSNYGPGPQYAPDSVKDSLAPQQDVQIDRQSVPNVSAPTARQNAWSRKTEDNRSQQSNRADHDSFPVSSSRNFHKEGNGFGQSQATAAGSQAIPAQNSAQDWPTAQQTQLQPQRASKVAYGEANAASTQFSKTGFRGAGKQYASRGFNTPIQITRMDWGEPLPNAQDTWGVEEPEPQPLPSAMPAAGKPSARRPAATPPAFPPMPGAQNDTPVQQSSRPAGHAELPGSMHWQRMWTTDALDHIGDEVRALLHVTNMPNLKDENGGAGWLISTSSGTLNLWQCTCIGSPGEPALQLVHSLETEFLTSDLQIDPANNLLMAVGRDNKAFTECVALHHLRLQPGIFRLKGRLNLPSGVTCKLAKNTGNVKALQVQSVDSHKGMLTGCCAASHDRTIAVYPANVVPGEVAKHKAVWQAHGRTITALHANRFCPTLLSGDDAGQIYIWSMMSRPTAPQSEVRHEKTITGLHSIGERSFVSCSMDGRLCVWDLNHGKRPVSIVQSPDGRPVLKMAVHHSGLVAFSTRSGLYVTNVYHDSPTYTVAINQPNEDAFSNLAWNTGSTGQIYLYASVAASISVFRASQYSA